MFSARGHFELKFLIRKNFPDQASTRFVTASQFTWYPALNKTPDCTVSWINRVHDKFEIEPKMDRPHAKHVKLFEISETCSLYL